MNETRKSYRGYFFLINVLALIGGFACWVKAVNSSIALKENELRLESTFQITLLERRRLLLETLDTLIIYQQYYRTIYGKYTKLIKRLGLVIPSQIEKLYEIRIEEASQDKLTVIANSEEKLANSPANSPMTRELVSLNQDFELRANFKIPAPGAKYLKYHALRHMRQLKDSPTSQSPVENGIFKGFFHYEIKLGSDGQKIVFANGIKQPVMGKTFELAGSNEASGLQLGNYDSEPSHKNDSSLSNIMTHRDEENLAQKIFYGETGRYAKSYLELNEIVRFWDHDISRVLNSNFTAPRANDQGEILQPFFQDYEAHHSSQTSQTSQTSQDNQSAIEAQMIGMIEIEPLDSSQKPEIDNNLNKTNKIKRNIGNDRSAQPTISLEPNSTLEVEKLTD